MARPRSDDARRVMVAFRATKEQVARWRAAAGGTCTLSDFVRSAADRDAAWAEDVTAAHKQRQTEPVTRTDYQHLSKTFDDLLSRARAGDVEALEALADASDRLLTAAAIE